MPSKRKQSAAFGAIRPGWDVAVSPAGARIKAWSIPRFVPLRYSIKVRAPSVDVSSAHARATRLRHRASEASI